MSAVVDAMGFPLTHDDASTVVPGLFFCGVHSCASASRQRCSVWVKTPPSWRSRSPAIDRSWPRSTEGFSGNAVAVVRGRWGLTSSTRRPRTSAPLGKCKQLGTPRPAVSRSHIWFSKSPTAFPAARMMAALHRHGGDALTAKVREGGRVNVRTSVATGVNARARRESPVPIGAEPFRQGREHGHGRFWPLLQYGV